MIAALPALVWVVGLALLWWRAEPLVRRVLDHWDRAEDAAAARATPPVMPAVTPMPVDLVMTIGEQSEPWAREQLGQKAQELYGQYRDWDMVRTALGVG